MQRLFNIKSLSVSLTSLEDGRILEINEKCLTTLGYTRDEVIGRTTAELNLWACPQERAELASILNKDSKVDKFLFKLRTKKGEIKTCQCSVETVVVDGQKCMLAFGYIKETMASNERKYRDFVENVEIIMIQADEAGKILYINEFGSLFLGYRPGELIGASIKETLLPEYESTGRKLRDMYDQLFVDQASSKQVVCEVTKRDGRRVWIEWINQFQKDAVTGELTVISVGMDITARQRKAVSERKKLERRRRDKLFGDLITGQIRSKNF